ncbi:hypothetical protein HRG_011586 [Hirsutella rhossiliensis]|uniref:Uncharacterized protein n=1 Tax=Hirsutella rhossiliensis TaxID=111463 RepID=A0A9P8SD05_9HYPO|nr:uncharacterized protein HRG_11586 [Hirsutella rhossiliensis]KAH0957439.1 hypothetical protein HRG_11586 [Hirsutella rhossiliensis]
MKKTTGIVAFVAAAASVVSAAPVEPRDAVDLAQAGVDTAFRLAGDTLSLAVDPLTALTTKRTVEEETD